MTRLALLPLALVPILLSTGCGSSSGSVHVSTQQSRADTGGATTCGGILAINVGANEYKLPRSCATGPLNGEQVSLDVAEGTRFTASLDANAFSALSASGPAVSVTETDRGSNTTSSTYQLIARHRGTAALIAKGQGCRRGSSATATCTVAHVTVGPRG